MVSQKRSPAAPVPAVLLATEDRFVSVVVEEDVSVSKRDEPDVVTERGVGGEVSVVPSGVVIVWEDDDVDQSQAGEIQPWLGCERRGHREWPERRSGEHRAGAVADVHGARLERRADGIAERDPARNGQQVERVTTGDRDHIRGYDSRADPLDRRSGKSDPRHLQPGTPQFALDLAGDPRIVERVRRVRDEQRVVAPGTDDRVQVGNASRCKKQARDAPRMMPYRESSALLDPVR